MSTEYARLKDSRPELVGGFNQIKQDDTKKVERVIRVNEK